MRGSIDVKQLAANCRAGIRYRDLPLGTVDASVVGAGERLELSQLATLDRRHFTVVRPAHIDAFELLPSQPDSG